MHRLEGNAVLIGRLLDFTSSKLISTNEVDKMTAQTIKSIENGQIAISQEQQSCQKLIDVSTKQKALANIYQSNDFYNYDRDLKIMSCVNRISLRLVTPPKLDRKKVLEEQQRQQRKKIDSKIKRAFRLKVKEWQAQKLDIKKRKQKNQQRQKSLQASSQQKKAKQQFEEKNFLQLFKQKSIEGKLRQIQERKMKRILHKSQSSSLEEKKQRIENYKYINAENKFMDELQKQKKEEKNRLQERSRSLELNLKQIAEHEKAYIQHIKKRLKMKSQIEGKMDKMEKPAKPIQSFNINKKDPEKIRMAKQKIERIKKIQQKVRQIPLIISQEKKKQIQIIGDKLKNKKKYHFLSQKALRDSQIYEEFKDFQMNIDKKDIGNLYFEQFKQQNQLNQSRQKKVQSQKLIPRDRLQYKDYIKQMRANKKNIVYHDQFQSIIKQPSQRDIEANRRYLQEKSVEFQDKAFQKIHELKSIQNYSDSINKEGEIDKNYAKAIRAKLALAKIQ